MIKQMHASEESHDSHPMAAWCLVMTEGTSFALPVSLITAICQVRTLTPLPQSHASVCGATNHHGTPLIVIAPFPVLQSGLTLTLGWMPAFAVVFDQRELDLDADAEIAYGFGIDQGLDTCRAQPQIVGDDLIIFHNGERIRAYDRQRLRARLTTLFPT